ncbi:MAG: hypothetical protein WDO56_02010 [Gammaproteobacteria bacterium]
MLSLYDWDDALRSDRSATSFSYVLGGGVAPDFMGFSRGRLGLEWEHTMNHLVGQRYRVLATLNFRCCDECAPRVVLAAHLRVLVRARPRAVWKEPERARRRGARRQRSLRRQRARERRRPRRGRGTSSSATDPRPERARADGGPTPLADRPPGALPDDNGPSPVIFPAQELTLRFNHQRHVKGWA